MRRGAPPCTRRRQGGDGAGWMGDQWAHLLRALKLRTALLDRTQRAYQSDVHPQSLDRPREHALGHALRMRDVKYSEA